MIIFVCNTIGIITAVLWGEVLCMRERRLVVNAEKRLTINYYWYYYGTCPYCDSQVAESYKIRKCPKCKGRIKWPLVVPKVKIKKNRLF